MKKIILMIVMIAGVYNYTEAQSTDNTTDLRNKIILGLKAGVNYSNVYDSKGEEFKADAKFGVVAGGFLAIPLGKYLGIQPEMLFSQKGFRASGRLLGKDYKFTRTTNYLDIPLMISLKPSRFVSIMAGPQYSFLFKQKDVFTNDITSIETETEFKNENIRKNTLSLIGGIDFTLKHIVIGTRAGWDLQKNNGDGNSTNPRYKNMWYQATVGYRF